MSKKYPKQEPCNAEVGIVSLACCDCGLVHKMGFTIEKDNKLRLDYERDERATAQLRRGDFPCLKKGNGKWIMIRSNETLRL